jgi:hypothetical protein
MVYDSIHLKTFSENSGIIYTPLLDKVKCCTKFLIYWVHISFPSKRLDSGVILYKNPLLSRSMVCL